MQAANSPTRDVDDKLRLIGRKLVHVAQAIELNAMLTYDGADDLYNELSDNYTDLQLEQTRLLKQRRAILLGAAA